MILNSSETLKVLFMVERLNGSELLQAMVLFQVLYISPTPTDSEQEKILFLPAIQTRKNSPIKSTLLIQVTFIFKPFHSFSPLLQEVSVLLPSHWISANVLLSFWTWFSVSLHVTSFIWNSLLSTLKFSWFTWPFNSSSLLSAPTFTFNLQVHLCKPH